MRFPIDWQVGCPPDDAFECEGTVYRIVKHIPPTQADFLSFFELGKRLSRQTPCPCMPYGLSVFLERADAVWMSQTLPKLGKYIAKGALKKEDGCSKPTLGQRPSHTTWWPCCECVRMELFPETEDAI